MRSPSVHDAHCHLADLADPDAAVNEARAAGVAPILAVAMGPEDGARVLDLKRRHPGVVAAGIGLHPSRVPQLTDAQIEAELRLVSERAGSADVIGEIGLDYKDAADQAQRSRQQMVLAAVLTIAAGARRPINLHSRRADREVVSIAGGYAASHGLPVLIHWFTHSEKLARRCGEEGIFISVGPSILIDSRQAQVVRAIDPAYLMVETDAPVVYGGEEARPAWAARVAERAAALHGMPPAAMAERLRANMDRYLGARNS